ncbi:MFS transporter [Dictyobacter sp. S3.2.2.5]|uniref:MFS transporter n=1 Tax=Dictyobacter halimunensis TaxID=3026934 RepID=A0ABQ6G076_9CHLR|nr:MFS transporter [Dictyobacter sp. S3.2.2.5]
MKTLTEEKTERTARNTGLWTHKNFLHLWAGQSISLLGSQVTQLALPLTAVVTLQATAFQMGLLNAFSTLPTLLIGLLVGVWIDRLRRRPLLIIADLVRAILLGSIPLAFFLHVLSLPYLYVIAFCTGGLTLFFDVAHMSLLPSIVSPEQIVDGNSKLETSRSAAWILGPGLAGWLIQLVSAPVAICVDAISFLASALFISRVDIAEKPRQQQERRPASIRADLKEGLLIVVQDRILRTLALSTATFNFFSSIIDAVYLLYIMRELHFMPSSIGFILAIGSLGFPFGALLAGTASKYFGIGKAIIWSAAISDLAFLLILFASSTSMLSFSFLVVAKIITTFTGPITAINQLSLRQMATPDKLLGRVNGTMRFIVQCIYPMGALLAGIAGTVIGLRPTLFIGIVGIQFGFIILLLSPVILRMDTKAGERYA